MPSDRVANSTAGPPERARLTPIFSGPSMRSLTSLGQLLVLTCQAGRAGADVAGAFVVVAPPPAAALVVAAAAVVEGAADVAAPAVVVAPVVVAELLPLSSSPQAAMAMAARDSRATLVRSLMNRFLLG